MTIDFEGFANDIIDASDDGDIGCDTVQSLALKHGLFKTVTVKEPCGDYCQCAEMVGSEAFPLDCYRKTYI